MKKVKGFTLIELMIVVAVIGILAAVVIQVIDCKFNGHCTVHRQDTEGVVFQ